MPLLTVSNLSKQHNEIFTVKDISFTQEPFQKIAIAGETGCGKTTLLKMIAGLEQPTAGEILFEEKKVIGPDDQLLPGHSRIAYLDQHFELRNNYFVYEILEMANKLSPREANTIYAVCRIQHLLKRRTGQLSGGEQQRIALARLLTSSPQLLLLDEPFSNLDTPHKNIIQSVIDDIGKKLMVTCIMVSHDAMDILSWADSILIMKDGKIIQQATPEEIYYKPVNIYCAGLFGDFNSIENTLVSALLKEVYTGKKLLLRPEQFVVSNRSSNGLAATVQKILFRGSHYILDVLIAKQTVRVKTNNKQFAEGDNVYISLTSGK